MKALILESVGKKEKVTLKGKLPAWHQISHQKPEARENEIKSTDRWK